MMQQVVVIMNLPTALKQQNKTFLYIFALYNINYIFALYNINYIVIEKFQKFLTRGRQAASILMQRPFN